MAEGCHPKQLGAKVAILGDTKVGKSCLFYRIKHKQFIGSTRGSDTMTDGPSYPMSQLTQTRGYDSCTRSFILDPTQQVNLTIMDSVHSHERGQSLSAQFYKRIQAVILVCSLDNEQSLIHLAHWIAEATVYIKNSTKDQRPVFVIAGTKCDIEENKRDVTFTMLQTFGNEHGGIPVYEVSAKTGQGVNEMLRSLADSIVEQAVRSGKIITPSHSSGGRHKRVESIPLLGGGGGSSTRQSTIDDDTFTRTRDVDDSCCCVLL